MADFITLTCPSCGGKLQITKETNTFACGHCGNEHIVRRSGNTISLDPLIQQVAGVRDSVDRNTSELAIRRLQDEIRTLQFDQESIIAKRDNAINSNAEIIKENSAVKILYRLVAGGIFGYIGLFGILGYLQGQSSGTSLSIMVLCFSLLSITTTIQGVNSILKRLSASSSKSNTIMLKEQLASIEKQISAKQKELARHYRIVANTP